MVNRGDGGARRPAPPSARPAPRPPARPADDDDNEKTNALNLADIDLDAIDAAPPSVVKPKAAPKDFSDDDNEKTNAINLKDIDLDAIDAAPPKKAPAPTPAPRTLQARTPAPAVEKPVAKAPPAPEKPVAKAPAPTPPPKKEEPVFEKTQAVSLDDFDPLTAQRALAKLRKGAAEPSPADRTYLVDDDDVPVVKAPPPKKLGKAAEEPEEVVAADVEPKLVVRVGPDLGRTFVLAKDLTLVGRGLDADFVINDASASRKHFNIVRTLSGWKLVDLGSGNGTKVDGNRVTELALKNGMRIEAGGTNLEFVHEDAASAAAPPKARESVREPEAPPKPRSPTLSPGVDHGLDAAPIEPPSRRKPADDKPAERKRDASRLDKFSDDKDELLGKNKGGSKAPPPASSEEKTSFGDIQALEIDPEWESRRLKQRREGVSSSTTEVEEVAEEVVKKKGGGAGKKIAIAGALVAVLGGGFVAADKFAGLGIIFPVAVTKPQPKDADADADKEKAEKEKAAKEKAEKENAERLAAADTAEPAEKDAGKAEENDAKAAAAGDAGAADAGAGDAGAADAADAGAVDEKAKAEAKAKIEEAVAAGKEKRWLAARNAYVLALKLDPKAEATGKAEVDAEVAALTSLVAATRAIEEKKFADAVKALEGIKEASTFYADAQEFGKLAKEGRIVEQLQAAGELLGKGDVAGAKTAIDEVMTLAGEYGEGKLLKEAIEKAGKPDADLLEIQDPSDPRAKAPPKAAPSDFAKPAEAHAAGDINALMNSLGAITDGGTASKAAVARANAMSIAAGTFDEAMKLAKTLTGKPDEALASLRSARRADAILGGGQKAKVAAEFAKVWGALAKKALDAKEHAKAGFLAKLALGLDAAQSDGKSVQTAATKQAKTWIAEAKNAGDAVDKAAVQYVMALRALPRSDADAQDADKALNALLAGPQ